MAVFPESMDTLNVKDTEKSLETTQRYIRYMAERLEVSVSNMRKTMAALEERVAALEGQTKE